MFVQQDTQYERKSTVYSTANAQFSPVYTYKLLHNGCQTNREGFTKEHVHTYAQVYEITSSSQHLQSRWQK